MPEEIKKIINKGFETRRILKETTFGVLSTISLDVEGYPFGSVTPYCLADDLNPLILISGIAQHTKNILSNSKVSLTVVETAKTNNVQAEGRVTFIGDAYKTEDENDKEKYLKYFPHTKEYFGFHDFSLFKINYKKIRFIGGFGNIFWVSQEDYNLINPLMDVEKGIVEHMNKDHKDSIIKYCKTFKNISAEDAYMIGIDSEGFDVLADNNLIRFVFEEPVFDSKKAREVLVKMARA